MLQYFPNITGSLQVTGSVLVSGSITATGGIIVSGSIASASYSSNSELLDNLDSTAFVFTSSFNTYSSSMSSRVGNIEGNYATTGSNIFTGAQTVCANITSTGTIIAQTLNVQQVTSSIVYSSGSNVFGCSLSNTQQFTGSVFVTGSTLTVSGGNLKSGDGNVLGRTIICTTSTPQILSTKNGSVGLTITSESDTNHFGWRITNQNVIDTGFEIARSSVTGSNNTFCSPYFVIKGDGTVGINCTSPTATLTVGGTSRFGSEATFVSTITGTSACFSSQICAPQSAFTYTGTTGNAVRINGDNLTTGTALSIVANNGSPSHTGNVVEICNAFNAGAAAKLLCLYQGDDGDGIYINMARGGVGLTVDGVGSGYSAIFNNGNVGIGCTAPSQKLDIGSGHIKLSDGYGLFYGTQTQVYASEASKYVRFDIAGTSGVMFLSGSGNVGIGTTTPVSKLHLRGSGTSGQVTATQIWENTSSGTLGLEISGSAGSSYATFKYGGGPGTGTATLTQAMAIVLEGAGAGRVGIGTVSPSDKFTVTDASTYTFNIGAASGGAGAVLYTLGSAALTFATNGSANERMRITSGGNVGIGTCDPQKPLELRTGGTSTTPSQLFAGGISQVIVGGETQIAFSSNISPTLGSPTATELARAGIGFQYLSSAQPSEFSIGIQCVNTCGANVKIWNVCERIRITCTGDIRVNFNPGGSNGIYFQDVSNGAAMFYVIPATYVGSAPYNSNRFLAANSSNIAFETGGGERLRITTCGTVKTQTNQAIGALDQSGTIANNASTSVNMNSAGGNGSIGFIAIGAARTDTTACQAVRLYSHSHTNGANTYSSIQGTNDGGITISDCVGSGVQYIVNCSGNTVNYVVRYINLISLNAIYERQ